MSLFSWWSRPKHEPVGLDPQTENEKRELKGDLAQRVMTFERRRNRVHNIAVQAVQSMREEHGR